MAARPRAATLFNAVALGVGVIGLIVVVRELGWRGVHQAVLGTGAWFVAIALVDLLGSACDAYGLRGFLAAAGARATFRHVFAAQLGGIAINRLTPGNSLGEPVKVTMLVRHVPTDPAVAAVMMFNVATIYLGIAAIAFGVPMTALLLDLPVAVTRVAWIGLGVLVVFAIVVGWLVRRGALGTLVTALERLQVVSPVRGDAWRARVDAIDRNVRTLAHLRSADLARGVAGVIGSRCFNWLGTVVVLHAADIPLSAPLVVASLTVGILVSWMTNVVPLGLGLADGTNYMLYGLLGASPIAGLLFTMVTRLRTVMLAVVGLSVMAIANAFHRRAPVGTSSTTPTPEGAMD